MQTLGHVLMSPQQKMLFEHHVSRFELPEDNYKKPKLSDKTDEEWQQVLEELLLGFTAQDEFERRLLLGILPQRELKILSDNEGDDTQRE